MKFTLSKDGHYRADFRTPHRLGYWEFAQYVARDLAMYGKHSYMLHITQKKFLDELREELRSSGVTNIDNWEECMPSEERAEIIATARAVVDRLFPKLAIKEKLIGRKGSMSR